VNRLRINLDALHHNLATISGWLAPSGAHWTLVSKVLCGNKELLQALMNMGVRSMGDTRMLNLQALAEIDENLERWYFRVPHLSIAPDVVRLAQASLNSEIEVIEKLNEEAAKLRIMHKIIIMIELGDLREGILPGSLVNFYRKVYQLPSIEVIGIGTNLGCLSGLIPNVDHLTQLVLYRELLELKFNHRLPLISAGTSSILPLLRRRQVPNAINHWRIGESLFIGSDLINNGTLEGLRDDVFILEAEIAEIKHKNMAPSGETGSLRPFDVNPDETAAPGQRGRRALITIGELDTDVHGLKPMNDAHRVVGASSDITVIHVGDQDGVPPPKVGDVLPFKLNYSALLRLMNNRYVEKHMGSLSVDLTQSGIINKPTLTAITKDEGVHVRLNP